MDLKHYRRQGCVSVWSASKSHGQLIACASTNTHNTSLFDLQILSVDLADPSKNLKLQGKSLYNAPYRCLAWGTFGQKEGTYPYGLIFGGMDNGSFSLWNPAEMMGHYDDIPQARIDDQNSFVYAEDGQEEGCPILCAEWNSLKNNFLAFGSTSLLILDISRDVSSPAILKPASPHEGSYITSVAWNKQVPHILASAGNDGLIALYDLKISKSIFSFRDNSTSTSSRNVQIAWSKHISTQIAVTLDDEKKNELQIWDLRNQKGPIVVIDKVHSKGINTMDWSELDHDLILTASRDNQLVCWNYKQDEQPLSLRRLDSQIAKVAWSKNLPSIYSVVTADGLSVYSLDDRNIHSYIPKWLKVSASSTFNGNENVISFLQERGNSLQQYAFKPQIKKQLSQQIAVLQQFLERQNLDALKEAEGQTGEFWKLIAAKKNQEGDSEVYQFLGLNKDKIIKQVEKFTGKKRESFTVNNSKSSKNKQKAKAYKADYIPISMKEADSIFGSLSQGAENLQKSFNKNDDEYETENVKYDMVPRNFNWDIGKEKLIKQNMLIGNYEGAIDAALKCGRTAEALIIAYSMDQSAFNSALKTFFTQTTDNFISGTLRYIAFKDTEQLVKKYDLDKWKQCIALIFSLSSSDKRKQLLSLLAKRLCTQQPQSQQHQEAAVYSYILAEQFEQIAEIYQKRLDKQKPNSAARKIHLTMLGTRLLAIYSTLTVNVKISQKFQRIIKELALICLQSNKKLLSYNLLTKYVSQSSTKYISYLISNTNQLNEYRTQATPIVSLPVMSKRQEKSKKNQRNQYHQQAPTNIKPAKQPRMPVKNAFNEPDNNQFKAVKSKQGGGMTPPPPPPPSHVVRPQVTPHQIPNENKTKGVAPPPPPPKKHHQQQEEDNQQEQNSSFNHPPPVKKNTNVPPPPPPQKIIVRSVNSPYEEQPTANKKNPPPPPPVGSQTKNIQKQQTITSPNYGKTSSSSRGPPPPPPPVHNLNKKESQQVYERQQRQQAPIKRVGPPPPPVNKSMPPPPPPSRGNPPPPARTVKKEEPEHDEQQDEQSQRQIQSSRNQAVNRQPPPPPPGPMKKASMPPPPSKNVAKMESQPVTSNRNEQQDQEEQLQTSQQIPRRGPPPPPTGQRRAPPPPPRR